MSGAPPPAEPPHAEPPPAEPPARSYAGDASLAAASRMLPFLVQLAATPFVVGELGAGGYAVWALLATTINLLLTADLGVVGVMQRYTSLHRGTGDAAATARVTTTVLSVLGALLVVMALAGPWIGRGAVAVVDVPSALVDDARFLFSLAGVIAVLHLVSLAMSGYLSGLERFGAVFAVSAAGRAVLVVGTAWALLSGAGLRGLALAALADAGTAALVGLWVARSHLRTAFRGWLRRAELAEVWGFAWRNQLSGLGFMAQRELDVVMAGVLLAASSIGAVAAAAQASAAGALFPLVFLSPLFSRLGAAIGRGDPAAVREQAESAQRAWLAVVVPYALVVLAVVPFAVPAWAGEVLPGAGGLAALLLVGLGTTLTVSVVTTLVRASGHPGVEASAYAAYVVVKVALGTALALVWGAWGLVGSTLVASVVFVVVVQVRAGRALGGVPSCLPPPRVLLRGLAGAGLAALLAAGAAAVVDSRVLLLVVLAAIGVLGLVAAGTAGQLRRGLSGAGPASATGATPAP